MTIEERIKEFEKICPLGHIRQDVLARMFTAVIEEEREACAALCDEMAEHHDNSQSGRTFKRAYGICAEAIRARGEK